MWPFPKSLEKIASTATDEDLIKAVRSRFPKKYDAFTDLQKEVNAVWWLRAETWNGTIERYFTNSTADDYPLLCRFLRRIGSATTLSALVEFGTRFGDENDFPPRSVRIDFVTQQEEADEESWRRSVRQASDSISTTFEDMIEDVAGFLRENLTEIEPNKTE
jgi:hypothetical protein